jgi:uncharacterized protein YjiS (DUF1127 family)
MHQAEHGVGSRLQAQGDHGKIHRAIGALVGGLAAWIMFWSERARQRRALAALDDRMLKDIGLTRVDVTSECDNPFWRV